jgi:hypothetical protein
LIVGPVFTREVITAPRRARLYIFRASYVAALLVLLSTAWQVLTGTQVVRNVGDLARFGATTFQLLAPLQLAVALFFSALSAGGAVAQEKDRRTFELLLLTRLTNAQLVLGRLLASLLSVLGLLVAALPLFVILAMLGGVSPAQISRSFAVAVASAIAAGSLGSTLGLWREKTFQTLALALLALVLWLGAGEALAAGVFGRTWGGVGCETLAACVSPWRATLEATRPFLGVDAALGPLGGAVEGFLVFAGVLCVALNTTAIALVRVWNPSRETRIAPAEIDESPEPDAAPKRADGETPVDMAAKHSWDVHARLGSLGREARPAATVHRIRSRRVWDNPVLWRETRTWAYGRRILVVRLAYLLIFAVSAVAVYGLLHAEARIARTDVVLPLAPLFMLSLVLINAQAVTALTSERDIGALDLLLVTDLTPKEFIYGKLGGILYNTKEMILLPIVLGAYLHYTHAMSLENLLYLTGGWLVLVAFAAMLGVHCGMTYASSRGAIVVSLATVFFLFAGVATCMRIIVAFSDSSFQFQMGPFVAMIVGGGVSLYVALGWRIDSGAIKLASGACPVATFYAITSFLLGYTLAVFLVVVAAYGFMTIAMLVPAIDEFDVATGRTTAGEGD